MYAYTYIYVCSEEDNAEEESETKVKVVQMLLEKVTPWRLYGREKKQFVGSVSVRFNLCAGRQ